MESATGVREPVLATMSVREILTRHPRLEAVFDRHGLGGCGGPEGPLEPLRFFALVHRVDPDVLVWELNAELARPAPGAVAAPPLPAAGRPSPSPLRGAPPAMTPPSSSYRLFLRTSLVLALLPGFGMGALLLLSRTLGWPASWGPSPGWAGHVQAHGLAQALGWMGLFIVGVALHVLPRFKAVAPFSRRVSTSLYAMLLPGVLGTALGRAVSPGPLRSVLLVAGGVLLVAGAVAFAAAVLSVFRRARRPAEGFELYVAAAAVWFVAASAGLLAIGVRLALTGELTVPDLYNEPLLHALLVGFAGQFALGVSLRILPLFLELPSANGAAVRAAFWALNAGLLLRALALLAPAAPLPPAGGLLEAGALAGLALVLAPWRRPHALALEARPSLYVRFVRAAYLWLLVAAMLHAVLSVKSVLDTAPSYLEVSAARHAFALGFLTLLVMGIAVRIVPTFGGAPLAWPRLVRAAFWLLLVSVSLRVLFTLLADALPGPATLLSGLSGPLGAAGFTLWAAALWRTLGRSGAPARHAVRVVPAHVPVRSGVSQPPPRGNGAGRRIEPGMSPAEVIGRYPATLPVFLSFGFAPLADPGMRETMGRSITLEDAARAHGVELERFLADLERAAAALPETGQRATP